MFGVWGSGFGGGGLCESFGFLVFSALVAGVCVRETERRRRLGVCVQIGSALCWCFLRVTVCVYRYVCERENAYVFVCLLCVWACDYVCMCMHAFV